jgi:hypothetical protein
MNNKLITTNKNNNQVLVKSKNLLDITNKILLKNDDNWIKILFKWADEFENSILSFPKNKKELLEFKSLKVEFYLDDVIGYLPEEIGKLIQLEELYLHDIDELPDTIVNLRNLKSFTLLWYSCEKSRNSELIFNWIEELKLNGCEIFIDCDIH